ncbi:PGF-pre-PGF domain-containing protein [Candidatus Woesearchaeota archaeon]|nr:PGF-pre-PGF domain-containing protein [Candidatus Woesearchaeota archaeon]
MAHSTSAAAAAETAAAAAAGGGGGGGAAAPSAEVASAAKRWDTLDSGSSAVLAVNNENIAITGVVVEVQNSVANAEVKVASLSSNPLTVAASAKAYQYLQLTKSNLADTDASKITISFRVPKSWLTSNSVAEADIVLYRYSEGTWNALPTSRTGDDANNVLYQATTPGFSTFAIGTKEAPPAVEPGVEVCTDLTDNDGDGLVDSADPDCQALPQPVAEICDDAIDNDLDGLVDSADTDCQVAPPPAPPAEEGISRTMMAWIIVGIIVIVAAVGYFMMQRKKAE